MRAKRLLVAIGALGALVGGALVLAPVLVSKDKVVAALKGGMEKAGFSMENTGQPSVSVGSAVHVRFGPTKLRPKEAGQGWQADVKQMELRLPLTALFGAVNPSAVALRGVDLRLLPNAATSESDPLPLQVLSGLANLGKPGFDLEIHEAILRRGAGESAPVLIDQLEGSWTSSMDGTSLSAHGQYARQALNFTASVTGIGAPMRKIRYDFQTPGLTFGFDGTRSEDAAPLVQGALHFESPDAEKARQLFTPPTVIDTEETAAAAPASAPNPAAPAASPAQAVKLSAQLYYRSGQFVLKEMQASAPGIAFTGEAGGATQSPYNIQANLQFPLLDTEALETAGGITEGGWLPALLNAALNARAKGKILLRAEKLKGLVQGEQLVALIELQDGAARIGQARMQAAGESLLGFDGGVTLTPQGPTLIGRVSAEGKSFREFLPSITAVPILLPERGFDQFAMAGDLRLSSEDLRLSDLRTRIGRTVANLAFIDQFETHEVGVRMSASDLDLDALFSMKTDGEGMRWQQKRDESGSGGVQTRLLPPYLQSKLLGLRNSYNLYLYLEKYVWDGAVRDPLEIRTKISRGKIELDQMTTQAAGGDVSIQGAIDVTNSMPKLSADIKLGDLDLGRLQHWLSPEEEAAAPNAAPSVPEGVTPSRWSNQSLNWHFVPFAEGTVNFSATRILHPLMTLTNASLKARLSNEQLFVDEASAKLFNADLRAKGQLGGGALPAWQTSFSLANLEIAEIGRLFPWLRDVQGRISFSGAAASSGISQLSQMRNMKGSLAMSGRAVQINQFDLSGAVDMLRGLNSVDNLRSALDQTLPQSNTRFDTLEGNIALDSGKITIPRILLRSPRFVGIIDGDGSLVDWVLNAKATYPLSVIRIQSPPELTVRASGPLDAPTITRDDGNLEKYVTDKTANEMIQGQQAR